jgi:hypothetical protein
VEELDPIKQLQSLIEDRGKVLEKISSIHSALGSIVNSTATPPPASQSPPEAVPVAENKSVQHAEDRLYGRLVQTLHDMQAQLEERVRPLAEQTVGLEVARLREQVEQDQAALLECLARIDQCILSCTERIGEYQNRHSELTRLNQRLATFGAEPQPLPEQPPPENAGEMIHSRLEELRLKGKI